MAGNQGRQRSRQQGIKVLERGDIYFIYRRKIEEASAAGLADVQRFFMILSPHDTKRYRLLVIGQKRLPAIGDRGERTWGFVEKASRTARALQEELAPGRYQTKTRGERTQPVARPAGEGVYALVRHTDHTHLVYALELPDKPGAVQEGLHLAAEGRYIVSIKNPEQPSPPGVGLGEERQASFPKTLQESFRGHRFIPVDPPSFLNYEGAEVLLIGAGEDVSEEVVRDVLVDRPNAHINLKQIRDEAADAGPVQELGWQEALQAVMPLRVNELSSSMLRLPISTIRRRGRCAPADRFIERYSQRRIHNVP
jgi:hypothetical protein